MGYEMQQAKEWNGIWNVVGKEMKCSGQRNTKCGGQKNEMG